MSDHDHGREGPNNEESEDITLPNSPVFGADTGLEVHIKTVSDGLPAYTTATPPPPVRRALNPFSSPAASAIEHVPLDNSNNYASRQNQVFFDPDGKEKKFGSALGLLTARFIQVMLVR